MNITNMQKFPLFYLPYVILTMHFEIIISLMEMYENFIDDLLEAISMSKYVYMKNRDVENNIYVE